MPELRSYLGLDYGMRRIGVAQGQSLLRTATPLATLSARDGIPDWKALDALVATWQPSALVVGVPLHLDGQVSAMTARAQKFIRRLQARYHLPVHAVDERLTSEEAQWLRDERGISRAGLDAEAAAILLESYLRELV